jgi:glycosyltransferase involved in cell wall biosynthesis
MEPDTVSQDERPDLTVVIPALNEEEAIGETIARCLAARPRIVEVGGLGTVQIIVVSDGSTDRTVNIARSFEEVDVLAFEQNRGYGAALKHGFRHGSGRLLGFLDADGTCEPRYFAELCRTLRDADADIALGARLTRTSQMPKVRRLGNRLFAVLLGMLSNRAVTDTASGMRVMRRDSLEALGPLPNGLHYTPAMSARALLKGLTVVEVPIPYEERIGRSKLSLIRDGLRFARAIVDGVLFYQPERVFLFLAMVAVAVAVFLSLYPVEFYLVNRQVEEWMIYRFVVAFLMGSAGVLSLGASVLANRLATLEMPSRTRTFWISLIAGAYRSRTLVAGVTLLTSGSLALVFPGFIEYFRTGHVSLHWSRVIVAAFGLLVAFEAALTGVLLRIMTLWSASRRYGSETGAE